MNKYDEFTYSLLKQYSENQLYLINNMCKMAKMNYKILLKENTNGDKNMSESYLKDVLNQLSKEELIYLIEQFKDSMFVIGEICVDESKCHIKSDDAIDKIRKAIYNIPFIYDVEHLKLHINEAICNENICSIIKNEYEELVKNGSTEK